MFTRDRYMIRETFNGTTCHSMIMDRHFDTEREALHSFERLRALSSDAVLYGPVRPVYGRRMVLESIGAPIR